MTNNEIRERVLKGGKIAIERLIERKRRDDANLVISENGKIVTVKARDYRQPDNKASNQQHD